MELIIITIKISIIFLSLVSYLKIIDGSISIATPKKITPFQPFIIYGTFNDTEVVSLTASLECWTCETFNKDSATKYLNQSDLNFDITLGSLFEPGRYLLNINTSSKDKFHLSSDIEFIDKTYTIIIQLHKTIYSPLENILFRVIVIDDSLKPVDYKMLKPMVIFIEDPNGDKLTKFIYTENTISKHPLEGIAFFNFSNGITNDISFRLSETSLLGDYKISVLLNQFRNDKKIRVLNFKSNLGSVNIVVPEFITLTNTTFDLKIEAKYYFNHSITGSLHLTSRIHKCDNNIVDLVMDMEIDKTDQSFENFSQKFDFKDHRNAYNYFTQQNCQEMVVIFTASVQCSKTLQIFNTEKLLYIYKHEYEVMPIFSTNTYSTHLGSELYIGLKFIRGINENVNASCIDIAKNSLKLNTEYFGDIAIYTILNIDKAQGKLNFSIRDKKSDYMVYQSYIVPTSAYCRSSDIKIELFKKSKLIMVNDHIYFKVKLTEKVDTFNYIVSSRGFIIKIDAVKINGDKDNLLDLQITSDMIPVFTVIVYYISNNNVIASDSITLPIMEYFQNKVNIDIISKMPIKAKDANQISFSVKTEIDSDILIIGEQISLSDDSFGLNSDKEYSKIVNLNKNVIQASSKVKSTFSYSNIIFESTMIYQCLQNSFYDNSDIFDPDKKDETDVVYQSKHISWFWDKIPSNQKSKDHTINIPPTIGDWRIKAVAINQQGISLVNVSQIISIEKELSIEILSQSIIELNKTYDITLILINNMDIELEVEIDVFGNKTFSSLSISNIPEKQKLTKKSYKFQTFSIISNNTGFDDIFVTAIAFYDNKNKNVSDTQMEKIYTMKSVNNTKYSAILKFDISSTNTTSSNISLPNLCPNKKNFGFIKYLRSGINDEIYNIVSEEIKRMPIDLTQTDEINEIKEQDCNTVHFNMIYDLLRLQYMSLINQLNYNLYNSLTKYIYNAANNPCELRQLMNSSIFLNAMLLKISDGYYKIKINPLIMNPFIDKINNISKELQIEKNIDKNNLNYFPNTTKFRIAVASVASYMKNFNLSENNKEYLLKTYTTLEDPNEYVITCLALHYIGVDKDSDKCFTIIVNMSLNKNNNTFWLNKDEKPDIIITSFALKILMKRRYLKLGLEAFRFLLSQKSFYENSVNIESMIGLETIIEFVKFAEDLKKDPFEFEMAFKSHNKEIKHKINNINKMIQIPVQFQDISNNTVLQVKGYKASPEFKVVIFCENDSNTNYSNATYFIYCQSYNKYTSNSSILLELNKDMPNEKFTNLKLKSGEALIVGHQTYHNAILILLEKIQAGDVCIELQWEGLSFNDYKSYSNIEIYPEENYYNEMLKLDVD